MHSVSPGKTRQPPRDAAGPLAAVLAGRITQARRDLGRMKHDPDAAIHVLRRRMKKLDSLLRLARDAMPKHARNELERETGSLKDLFAAQRDFAVSVKLARRIGGEPLARAIERERPSPPAGITAQARKSVNAMARLLRGVPVASLSRKRVLARQQRAEQRAMQAWREALRKPSAVRLHAWRRRAKIVHHHLLFQRALGGGQRRRIQLADHIGHWLGELHDLHVLEQTLARCAVDPGLWQEALTQRERRLEARALRAGRSLHAG